MRSTQIFSAVLGACILVAPLPTRAARAPAPASGEDDSEAKQLFQARKYPEAALLFEQLFAGSGAPRHLFNAAMARELAGHEGHAYVLLRRYLALPDLQSAEIERARDRLDALQQRTAAVHVVSVSSEGGPLHGRGLELTLERPATGATSDRGRAPLVIDAALRPLLAAGDDAVDLHLEQGPWVVSARAEGHAPARQELAIAGGQAEVTLTLPAAAPPSTPMTLTLAPSEAIAAGAEIVVRRAGEPVITEPAAPAVAWELASGEYTLSARAPGYQPLDHDFTVTDQPLALDLVLVPEAAPVAENPPPAGQGRWALGLGIAGGVSAVAGAVAVGVGTSQWSRALGVYGDHAGSYAAQWDIASGNLFRAWTVVGAGGGLLGGGVGLGLGALGMHLAPRLGSPRRLWGAGLGVGAALAVAGGLLIGRAGYGVQSIQWAHADRFPELDLAAADALAGRNHHVGASAALLGLGVGLGVSSVLGLIRTPKRASHAAVMPTGTGLVLSGRF